MYSSFLRNGFVAAALLLMSPLALSRGWIRAESDHFVVYSNVSSGVTRDYIEQLESFKQLAELLLGANGSSSVASARFTLYLLGEQEQLNVVRPALGDRYAGVYMHCDEGAIAFAVRPVQYSSQDTGLQTLLHEYTHHLMFSRMQRFYPSWYVEGFADYLSTVTLARGAYSIGGNHLGRYYQLTSEAAWMDFAPLLDQTRYIAEAKKGKLDLGRFYAQSWLLAHYMLSDSNRTQAFNRYFLRMGNGEDALTSFEAETGLKVAQLPSVLRRYLTSLHGIRAKIPGIADAEVRITELPKAQSDYILEAAVLQTCPPEDHAKHLLEQFRSMHARHADDDRFMTALSRAELLYGDAAVARSTLESLAQKSSADFEVFYLLGRSYYDQAARNAEQHQSWMAQASQAFLTAYRLNKLDAPNLYFLSKSLDDGAAETISKAVINAANAAAIFAPGIQTYAMNAAFIDLRAEDRATAIRVLRPFASNPHDVEGSRRIADFIEGLRQNKTAAQLWAAFTAPAEKEGEKE